ncbi:AbrB/MazE/SpoVT family DNA-binding domain-containing protein [Fructilactobacillus ixorae]|uniref:AbrB/MazE/SpoVT family DNA-binding domain-containing protein n=1 Tax=Fructilactobacillus ixorae TaxID=1750535 RepID=A0ABY5C557_9LACO|nr:AbrB/MazE/SpoVT family DNA-binding domain-containing protein [Fructilactobacillus ixorae]USS93255.1 AbrB/MazE/SpoVT family DNA-binding domain-containing protein [Fructilactobacillus ixorae]
MTIKSSTISKKGQVVIPADLRKELGLNAGDKVNFVKRDGVVMVEKASSADVWNSVLDKMTVKRNRVTEDEKAILVDPKHDDPDFVDWALHG